MIWKTLVWIVTGKSSTGNDVDSIMTEKDSVIVDNTIKNYLQTFKENDVGRDSSKIEERKSEYQSLVRSYYNLATDFYEYGWGESFHFAPRFEGETFKESIARHEYYLASRLGLKNGMKVLDCGCGVGGPMRSIARFADCDVTGVTICPYQVSRGNALNQQYGLSGQCRSEFGDFMNLGKERACKFDAAYGIEATCHAPDRTKCFKEVYQTLKPGGYFAVYEWVMTPLYDKDNAYHRYIKHEIEKGDSLPDLTSQDDVLKSFRDAGFEILEAQDVALEYKKKAQTIPWYATLQGGFSLSQIKHSKFGRFVTHALVSILEFLWLAPKGTSVTHEMLCGAAESLAIGGESGIFTPMYFVLGRKPVDALE